MKEIFSPGKDIPFGGKSVLVCRDLCQLPSVRVKSVFNFNETETMGGFICMVSWRKFRLAERNQVMRQGYETFVSQLNKTRSTE